MQQLLGVFAFGSEPASDARMLYDALKAEHANAGHTVHSKIETPAGCLGITGLDDSYAVHHGQETDRVTAIVGECGIDALVGARAVAETVGVCLNRLADADGCFSAASFDSASQQGWIGCDRLGFMQLYWKEHQGSLVFASCGTYVARATATLDVDGMTVVSMLAYGQPLGSRSMFKGVSVVGPGEILVADRGGLSRRGIRSYEYAQSAEAASTGELRDAFSRGLTELDRIGRPASRHVIPLSGGLDSRLIAACVSCCDQDPLTFTFGHPKSGDALLARAVARTVGSEHLEFPLLPEGLAATLDDVVEITSGEENVIHSHGYTAYPIVAAPGRVALSGFAGDLVLGGSWLPPSPQLAHLMVHLGAGMRSAALGSLLNREGTRMLAEAEREIQDSYAALPEEDPYNRADHLALLLRARRWTANGLKLIHAHLPYRLPFFQKDFFDRILALPVEQRRHSALYMELFSREFPSLAKIPWQRTGMPLTKGVWLPLGRSGTHIPNLRGAGRISKRYRTGFVDYEQWFAGPLRERVDSALQQMRLLESGVLDKDAYCRLIADVGRLRAPDQSLVLSLEMAAGAIGRR
jgi:asparagine synthase (glutamine-hydrolysing)